MMKNDMSSLILASGKNIAGLKQMRTKKFHQFFILIKKIIGSEQSYIQINSSCKINAVTNIGIQLITGIDIGIILSFE